MSGFIISIHAPTRGATPCSECFQTFSVFQSTLPREERPMPFTFFTRFKYFNPRSHERSDGATVLLNTEVFKISIHAPTRGATLYAPAYFSKKGISIHAPTRGATKCTSIKRGSGNRFQSTLPREERRWYMGCKL